MGWMYSLHETRCGPQNRLEALEERKIFAPAENQTTIPLAKYPCLVQAIIMKEGSNKRKADEMDKDCSSPMNRREWK
jgi:hypothetical protein